MHSSCVSGRTGSLLSIPLVNVSLLTLRLRAADEVFQATLTQSIRAGSLFVHQLFVLVFGVPVTSIVGLCFVQFRLGSDAFDRLLSLNLFGFAFSVDGSFVHLSDRILIRLIIIDVFLVQLSLLPIQKLGLKLGIAVFVSLCLSSGGLLRGAGSGSWGLPERSSWRERVIQLLKPVPLLLDFIHLIFFLQLASDRTILAPVHRVAETLFFSDFHEFISHFGQIAVVRTTLELLSGASFRVHLIIEFVHIILLFGAVHVGQPVARALFNHSLRFFVLDFDWVSSSAIIELETESVDLFLLLLDQGHLGE